MLWVGAFLAEDTDRSNFPRPTGLINLITFSTEQAYESINV